MTARILDVKIAGGHRPPLEFRHLRLVWRHIPLSLDYCKRGLEYCNQAQLVPSLHHRKEGWPSDQEKIAKHPLLARPGWFSDGNKKENHPGCVCFGCFAIFFDDAATPPCGDARRGLGSLVTILTFHIRHDVVNEVQIARRKFGFMSTSRRKNV